MAQVLGLNIYGELLAAFRTAVNRPCYDSHYYCLCLRCSHRHSVGPSGRMGLDLACPQCNSRHAAYWNQTAAAFIAEWLTRYLLDGGGARREESVKREAERVEFPWEIVRCLASEMGFVGEDRWRLPDDHPFRNLDFTACPSSTVTSRSFPDAPAGADVVARLDTSSQKSS